MLDLNILYENQFQLNSIFAIITNVIKVHLKQELKDKENCKTSLNIGTDLIIECNSITTLNYQELISRRFCKTFCGHFSVGNYNHKCVFLILMSNCAYVFGEMLHLIYLFDCKRQNDIIKNAKEY